MSATIRHLPARSEAPGRPDGAGADHPMRKVTRQVAFEPGGWTPERAAKVGALFDDLAGEWHTRDHPHRLEPLADAFDRGGPLPEGLCLEIGSGTGLATPWLAERRRPVVAVDLSWEMLRRAPGTKVRADASRLPFGDGEAALVVLINMLLFPSETDRVLRSDGAVVWVNTSGDRTPIHLSADDVVAALPGSWEAVASAAGWGTWAVVRRA
jgi:SAM-dependent methyltransferase